MLLFYVPTITSRFPLVAYIIHHTLSLAFSHTAYQRDSKFPATHSPPVCIFLYDEYICYEKWHHKFKWKYLYVPLPHSKTIYQCIKRFWAGGSISHRKRKCRTRVPRVLNHSTRQRWGVSFTTQLLYPQGNWPLGICWIGSWVEARAGQHALEKQNISFHCWETCNDYLEACIIVTTPISVSRLVTQ